MNKYTISSMFYNSIYVNGITNYAFTPSLSKIVLGGSGQIFPSFTAVSKANPVLTFATTQIKAALNALGGIAGVSMDTNKLTWWMQKVTESTTRSGNVHRKIETAGKGIIVPQQLTVTDGQPAIISYQAVFTSADGTTSPFTITDSQALPGQAGAAEAYTLGAISLCGATLDGPISVTIDFGLAVDISGGKVYPTDVAIMAGLPSITIVCQDVDEVFGSGQWGETGKSQDASDSVINLDDMLEGGVRGSTPITITLDEGHMNFEDITGDDGARLGTSILYTPTDDGVAAIMALGGLA